VVTHCTQAGGEAGPGEGDRVPLKEAIVSGAGITLDTADAEAGRKPLSPSPSVARDTTPKSFVERVGAVNGRALKRTDPDEDGRAAVFVTSFSELFRCREVLNTAAVAGR